MRQPQSPRPRAALAAASTPSLVAAAIRRRLGGRAARLPIGILAAGLLAFAVLAPARADESFTAGSAQATADLFGIVGRYGGGEIGFGIGDTRANFLEGNAKATAQTANLGFLGLLDVAKLCGEGLPFEAPAPTEANTNNTGGEPDIQTKSQTGTERAEAYPGSRGVAQYDANASGFPGILAVEGGSSRAEAVLDPAALARTATGDVRIGRISLLNGLVVLGQVEWHLEQAVTGSDSRSHETSRSASFSIGSISIARLPILDGLRLPPPLDQLGGGLSLPVGTAAELASSIATVNGVLGPLGLVLRLPEVVEEGEQRLRITPLTIAVGGNPVYGPLLYPLVAGTQDTSVLNLFNQFAHPTVFDPTHCNQLGGLMKPSPEFNFMWNAIGFLAPIVIQVFAGSLNGGGEFAFEVGGATTTVDDTYYPPRERRAVDRPAPSAPEAPAASGTGRRSVVTPGASGTEGTPGPPGSPAVPAAVLAGDETSQCETTSPVGRPGCWKGIGKAAAGLLGALTAGLLVTDEIWRRRRESELLTEEAMF